MPDPDVIPLFPLGTVLLPGSPLPLHIFEPRYRQLMSEVMEGSRSFGVVALRQGTETSATGAAALEEVGTLARVVQFELYQDGRSTLLAVGSTRFRIVEVDAVSRPYLQARVEWLGESDGDVPVADVGSARELAALYARALAALTGRAGETEELPTEPMRLSYAIAARLQLSNADRQRLLASATAAERLKAALILLRRETVLLRETRTVPVANQVVQIAQGLN